MTSVKDCGLLLERIYRGECVSEEASAQMLDLLKRQENTSKIPAGIKAEVPTANKTGETDEDQHDIAIVYGAKTTYILCVMSEGISGRWRLYVPNGISRAECIVMMSRNFQ